LFTIYYFQSVTNYVDTVAEVPNAALLEQSRIAIHKTHMQKNQINNRAENKARVIQNAGRELKTKTQEIRIALRNVTTRLHKE